MIKAMLGCLIPLTIMQGAMALTFAFGEDELAVILDMQKNFFADSDQKGFVTINNKATKVLPDEFFLFLEGPMRFEFEFNNVNAETNADDISLKVRNVINEYFIAVTAKSAANVDVLTFAALAAEIRALDEADAATFAGFNANIASQIKLVGATGLELGVVQDGAPGSAADEDDKTGFIQDNNDPTIALGPNVFCLASKQCQGNREQKVYGDVPRRDCNGNNDVNVFEVIPKCNDFVAFFTLRWLLVLILATYGIIVLWALYWIYPWFKKKYCGGKSRAKSNTASAGPYSEQDQLIINTLAAQCAAAENLLFQATDMKKQAISMENIVAVEAKRESRIMVYTVEYFQACCAVVVSLTHSYLDRKTNTPGEKWSVEDATTRALQLEVLNYVRDRLTLAFNSDAMTDKSLYRIAEAYAILKKISDSIVLVGFSYDMNVEGSLGALKTPFVELTEDAIFLGGVYKPTMQIPGGEAYANSPVCVAMDGASRRDVPAMSSSLYLANQQRDAKIYDPQNMMVKPGVGKALGFSSMNQAQNGEGLQFFVRTFWANEIGIIQGEAQRWLTTDGALEDFLDNERLEREGKASPVIKAAEQPKKRRRKKKHRKNDEDSRYAESNDGTTEYSEASGWSVKDENNYVFNVNSVVAQGLGIAGKPGLPYDKPGETPIKKGSKLYATFEYYFPNYAEWPKFYTLVFVIIPIAIALPMLAKIGKGAGAVDIDGNVNFKARVAGFGTSYLGVPAYYFLDGFVPETDDLEANANDFPLINLALDLDNQDRFENGKKVFISNKDAAKMFENDFDGASGRKPEDFITEIQAGILAQADVGELDNIRNQQLAQETTTMLVYALMHNAGYFFGLIPLTLVRESLEILARRFNFIRSIYPLSQWRELHMSMGLAGIYYVAFGATVFLVTALTAIGRSTPFAGLAGDPNIGFFFDLSANVLYIRQFLLPAVPLLFLMKYAARGPPRWMRKYAPTIITLNYWEICYFLHYFTALTAIIILVIYRPQVFYWMGATWGFVWGGNKIVRILRTRKTTINNVNLVSYTVEDKRNNGKKRSDVLRITLNVPSSFPSSSRGQACWLTCPNVDYIAHPFTLAKVPTETDKTIMFHIAVRYLAGDDIISYAKPDDSAKPPPKVVVPPTDPNALPPNWKSAVDPNSGQTYYYNSIEGKTTWTPPKNKGVDRIFDGVRGITTRMSANILRGGSARFGAVGGMRSNTIDPGSTKTFAVSERPSWTQKFANLAYRLQTMDPDLRRNAVKNFPVYVSAPLGTSMDDCLLPSLPGSIIITTQNGLPAGESSVRWLLKQEKARRPKFHFFVSVSREVNDALSVIQTLRDGMCESVAAGHLNIDGLDGRNSHMVDWLGCYVHLTRRKGSQIEGDRDMLMRSMNPPKAQVTEKQLELINTFIRNRVMPGRLPFDRFLARTQQMVRKRCGVDNMAVGYCGSSVVAHNIRSACRRLERVHFDGEYI